MNGDAFICPDANVNVNESEANGSFHGPIDVKENAVPFAIEQTGTLTFLHKFGARKTENWLGIYAVICICMPLTAYMKS